MSAARPAGWPWICVTRMDEIPKRSARVVETDAGPIAIFRTSDDSLFALHDRCPHRGGPLSQGLVHGHRVTCPLHDLEVCLETGRPIDGDGDGAATRHAVRVDNGRIYLAVTTWQPTQGREPPCA